MTKAMRMMAVAALAAVSTTAQAADFSTIGCIEGQVPPIIGKRFGDATIAEAQASVAGTTPARVSLDEEVGTIADIAAGCQGQHGWSDQALEASIGYSIARTGVSGARSLLMDSKVDPTMVERVYAALPLQHRAAFALSEVPDEAVAALMEKLKGEGMTDPTREVGVYIGILAGLLALAEVELDRFVKN